MDVEASSEVIFTISLFSQLKNELLHCPWFSYIVWGFVRQGFLGLGPGFDFKFIKK
jgi:hypothetical protein